MQLGAFSVSLAVADLKASETFYTKLGFEKIGGDEQHYMMLRNGETVIGLFQGMFEGNVLTFNPGWDQQAQELGQFQDVRELQQKLKNQGIELTQEADQDSDGVAHFTLVDPDGNAILVDQHVPKP